MAIYLEVFRETLFSLLGDSFSIGVLLISLVAISVCSYILLLSLRRIALERNLFDKANERSVHSGRIPRLGGLMFVPMLIFTVSFLTMLSSTSLANLLPWLSAWHLPASWFCLQAGLLIIMAVGFRDDLIGMRYGFKFMGQALAGLLLLSLGESYGLTYLIGLPSVSSWGYVGNYLQAVLDLLFILSVINAFNLIDGIDGLSSGLSIIAFGLYALLFAWIGDGTAMILCLMMLAILCAFMRMNLLRQSVKRTKMFMGDTGSMTLGFMLAAVALTFPVPVEGAECVKQLPLMLVLSPLMIPLMDLVWVFTVRIASGHNPFLADKTHVHHRLMATGLTQRQTLCVLLTLSLALVLLNGVLSMLTPYTVLLIDLMIWLSFNWLLYRLRKTE